MEPQAALPSFLRFHDFPLHWQMAEPEKAALLQLLDVARPEVALEIGTYHGGSLQVLANRAAKVYSIDIDPTVAQKLRPRFANVDFRTGPSGALLPDILGQITARAENLGLVLVDGDHSRLGVRRDVDLLLQYVPRRSLFVVCHDSFNPDCRRGLLEADWGGVPFRALRGGGLRGRRLFPPRRRHRARWLHVGRPGPGRAVA